MEIRRIAPRSNFTTRLVKSEDLNHHGTLFAGRASEWFVESGFIAAATLLDPRHVVCLKIHGLYFTKPVHPGGILKFESKIVYAGKSSLTAYVQVLTDDNQPPYVSGFITFIHVDETTRPSPHGLEIVPENEADIDLFRQAQALKTK